jgi:hypothetical protein
MSSDSLPHTKEQGTEGIYFHLFTGIKFNCDVKEIIGNK